MILQVILGTILFILGILSAGLGGVFIIASHGIASRLISGGLMGAAGLALLIAGVVLFRRGVRHNPAAIRRELLRLARVNDGELTDEVIAGSLGHSDVVGFQVASLLKEGIAVERTRDDRRFYLFEDFKLKMVLKKCPYCGNDYPVRDDIEKCPSCGGDLKIDRSAYAGRDGKFSMDEEDDSGVS